MQPANAQRSSKSTSIEVSRNSRRWSPEMAFRRQIYRFFRFCHQSEYLRRAVAQQRRSKLQSIAGRGRVLPGWKVRGRSFSKRVQFSRARTFLAIDEDRWLGYRAGSPVAKKGHLPHWLAREKTEIAKREHRRVGMTGRQWSVRMSRGPFRVSCWKATFSRHPASANKLMQQEGQCPSSGMAPRQPSQESPPRDPNRSV